MKWFLVQFWHFVTTSNVLGVIFGLALGTWWKRIGRVEFKHVPDNELFSESELLRAQREDDRDAFVNVFNKKGVAIFILGFELEQNGVFYKARRKRDVRHSNLDVIKVDAWSVQTMVLTCEVVPQKGDYIWVSIYNKSSRIKFKIR